eukprot:m.98384 g.98384  ORF g.98384 m.98384 type:complete len:548 (+) comp27060_c0_seq1:114-1757(+)
MQRIMRTDVLVLNVNRTALLILGICGATLNFHVVPCIAVPSSSNCSSSPKVDPKGYERFGGDYAEHQLVTGINASLDICAQMCCGDGSCVAISYNNPEPSAQTAIKFELNHSKSGLVPPRCTPGFPCCKLKNEIPPLIKNTYGVAVTTAVVRAPTPTPGGWPRPNYPNSTFIKGVTFEWVNTVVPGVQGDTWPSAQLSNGKSFAMGCDNTPPHEPMAWMNWWSVSGDEHDNHVNLTLINDAPVNNVDLKRICGQYINSTTGTGNIKPSSVLAIDNTLYAGVQCMTYDDHADATFPGRQRCWNAWIITSEDEGRSWNVSATSLDFFGANLTNPMFIKAGAGYKDAPDEYVYIHFPAAAQPDTAYWDGNDFILLGRVPKDLILVRSAYEFYASTSPSQELQPTAAGVHSTQTWSSDARLATPIFSFKHMTGQDHTFYNVGLKRYILPNYGFMDPRTGLPVGWHYLEGDLHKGIPSAQLALFESATPWGPWSLFYLQQPWNINVKYGAYCPDFPGQWTSEDGLELRMVYSACCGAPQYSFHATNVKLNLF